MESEPAPAIAVLCPQHVLPRVQAAGQLCLERIEVRCAILDGDLRDAISATRALSDGALGVIVEGESAVLEALRCGADEAVCVTDLMAAPLGTACGGAEPHGAEPLIAFFQRAARRARLRTDATPRDSERVAAEKLAALAALVGGVAHEVNNPLTALVLSAEGLGAQVGPLNRTYAALAALAAAGQPATTAQLHEALELGRSGAVPDESDELLQEITEAADSIGRVVRDLVAFARQDQGESPARVALPSVLKQVLVGLDRRLRTEAHLEIDCDAETPAVVVPRAQLGQVIGNLLVNALHAVREAPARAHCISVRTQVSDATVVLSVTDTGQRLSPDALPGLFDPFFTTKRGSVGVGLNLSVARSILRKWGGDLRAEPGAEYGTTFVAVIARAKEEDVAE